MLNVYMQYETNKWTKQQTKQQSLYAEDHNHQVRNIAYLCDYEFNLMK